MSISVFCWKPKKKKKKKGADLTNHRAGFVPTYFHPSTKQIKSRNDELCNLTDSNTLDHDNIHLVLPPCAGFPFVRWGLFFEDKTSEVCGTFSQINNCCRNTVLNRPWGYIIAKLLKTAVCVSASSLPLMLVNIHAIKHLHVKADILSIYLFTSLNMYTYRECATNQNYSCLNGV